MRKQLIIQLARFGDLIQSKRLARTLAGRGELHLCLDRSLAALAEIIYPEAVPHPLAAHGALNQEAVSYNRAALEIMAGENFDEVYNLNHSGLNLSLARLFDPLIVKGYAVRDGQPLRSSWVRLLFRLTRQRKWAPVNLVDYWAFFADNPLEPALVNPAARPGGKGIGVVLAGREKRRSLPPTLLAEHVRLFFELLGGPPVFIFGAADQSSLARKLMREFSNKMLDRTQNLAGKTDLPGLAEALRDLDILLTPDTGVMHLAAHLGVPVFAFFLSSAWCFETGPYGLGHHVAQASASCLPCLESARCSQNENKPPCLAPFGDPFFKALLSEHFGSGCLGRAAGGRKPENLMLLASDLDSFGGRWREIAGADPVGAERGALRFLLAEYSGVSTGQWKIPDASLLSALSERMFQETDWVLPREF